MVKTTISVITSYRIIDAPIAAFGRELTASPMAHVGGKPLTGSVRRDRLTTGPPV